MAKKSSTNSWPVAIITSLIFYPIMVGAYALADSIKLFNGLPSFVSSSVFPFIIFGLLALVATRYLKQSWLVAAVWTILGVVLSFLLVWIVGRGLASTNYSSMVYGWISEVAVAAGLLVGWLATRPVLGYLGITKSQSSRKR